VFAPIGRRFARVPDDFVDVFGDSLISSLTYAVQYDTRSSALVRKLKTCNQRSAINWLADRLVVGLRIDGIRPTVVTWVPTTRRHVRMRGFEHGELYARAVATRLALPCVALLDRVDNESQAERAHRGGQPTFAARPGTPLAATDLVLLVDDVWTTGTTIGSAASALRDSYRTRTAAGPRIAAACALWRPGS
jgi:predicted amidophosphoribosyltransferase